MKSKEINALFSFVSFLHENAREFSNFNDYASDVTNLANSPLSFAAEDHNDKMKEKAAMRLRIQEYSTPIIENVEGPIKEKLAELGILNGGIGLNLIDFSSAVSEVKNSIYSDISDIEKCKAEYLEVCATITPLREYFFPLFHSIDRILIDELFPYFLPKESITDFNEYRSSNVEVYLPTAEQQGADNYLTPAPGDDPQPLTPQPIIKQKPEPNGKLITLKNGETIEKLHSELKGYFHNKEAELLKALQGEQLSEMLLFPHNQNKLVEVFRRLKYNGLIINTDTEIKEWICATFMFRKKGYPEPQPFKNNTVWDILSKGRGEPTRKKQRICVADWLPYKSVSQLEREKESEKL